MEELAAHEEDVGSDGASADANERLMESGANDELDLVESGQT